MPRVAAIQMTSTADLQKNLRTAKKLIEQAAAQGAQLAVLPENFALMGNSETDKINICEQAGKGVIQNFLAEQAEKNNIWLVGGTIPLAASDANKVRAACLVYNSQGKAIARYDKIHLFDVCVEAGIEEHHESRSIEAGNNITIVDTPVGRLGLAVCYDIRFPELFRLMLQHKVEIIALPAAFTFTTGQAHWEILTRARAIENFCFLIGACQTGAHENGRKTFGHSVIIHPWGNLLAEQAVGEGIIVAELNLTQQQAIRKRVPIMQHQRIRIINPFI